MSTSTGSDWTEWDKAPASREGEKWKPSGNVGAIVRLTILDGAKVIPGTAYGDWHFVEATVDVIEPDGSAYTTHPETALSGAWFRKVFAQAPQGYQALGVIATEEFPKGTGYKMRPLTDAEQAIVSKALPAF
jgi:hypothetical protein